MLSDRQVKYCSHACAWKVAQLRGNIVQQEGRLPDDKKREHSIKMSRAYNGALRRLREVHHRDFLVFYEEEIRKLGLAD